MWVSSVYDKKKIQKAQLFIHALFFSFFSLHARAEFCYTGARVHYLLGRVYGR